ncbi:MAG: PqqD family protein [Candidatus Cohnella colombiensis]|uniref:PqqD family protein n=1 Tax=Candidatus Cohnella colombiensis TaxID=3121368 RepID=A0AA95EXV8_9BACL|nr:MAG: PqqD family protein [Cohnella sp.]
MSTMYLKNEKIEAMEMDGQLLLLNPDCLSVTKVNEVGGFIWSYLNESVTIDYLEQRILQQYEGIEPIQVEQDVRRFLDHLIRIGLVRCA